eukprot:Gb_15511 [translate_table: standard]
MAEQPKYAEPYPADKPAPPQGYPTEDKPTPPQGYPTEEKQQQTPEAAPRQCKKKKKLSSFSSGDFFKGWYTHSFF